MTSTRATEVTLVKNGNQRKTKKDQPAFDDGPKHDFRKVTVTLPQPVYEVVIRECARRKVAGERNHLMSSLIREAVSKYLEEDSGQ